MNRDAQRRNSMRSQYRNVLAGHRDLGQQYVVYYNDGMMTERIFGYADNLHDLSALIRKIGKHPIFSYTRTVERRKRKTA